MDFGILGRSGGCSTRQFGDGAWRSEARIPPGLPLGATSKPTVSNRVGARKQIKHFFRGQNPTKSQKNPDFQPRGQNFTKSQKNPDFQPRGQNPTKSQKKPRLPTQRSELYKITEKPRLQSLSSYTVYTFRFDTCFVHPPVTKTPTPTAIALGARLFADAQKRTPPTAFPDSHGDKGQKGHEIQKRCWATDTPRK